jgi:hypothetical protein
MEDSNMFEETVVSSAAAIDDDFDIPEGPSGPMYQINFGKEHIRVMLDSSIKAELPHSSLKEEFTRRDYKTVIQMMNDLKGMSLSSWQAKYFKD